MAQPPRKNPIEQRIDFLASLWNDFAKDPEPRLLRWLVDDDGVQMVDLLIEVQRQGAGDIPDLFLQFTDPFQDAESYAMALLKSFQEQYQGSREEILSAELPADWQCPQPMAGETSLETFIRACVSFMEYYQGKMLTLVLALSPSGISHTGRWQRFLQVFVQSHLPQTIRLTVIDPIKQPILGELCDAEPKLTRTVWPIVDLASAREEIAANAEGVGPGHEFRLLFVKLGNAIEKKDTAAANKHATSALRIATKHNWPDLQVVIHMMVGGMHLSDEKADEALMTYRQAEQIALQAQQAEHPAGAKLVVQTRFAQGGILFSQGKLGEAAQCYEGTVPFTKDQDDAMMELEAWRMASFCYRQNKSLEKASMCGYAALDAGERLDAEMRPNSTLPYAGRELLTILHKLKRGHDEERAVRERMALMLGVDWEAKLDKGGDA